MLRQIQARHEKVKIPAWMQTYFGFSLLENVEKQCAPLTDDEKRLHLASMAKTYRLMGIPFSQDRAAMERFSREIKEEQAAVTENVPRHAVNILRLGEMIDVSSGPDSILPMLAPKTRGVRAALPEGPARPAPPGVGAAPGEAADPGGGRRPPEGGPLRRLTPGAVPAALRHS